MRRLLKPLRYVYYRTLAWKMRDPDETTPVLVAGLGTSLLLVFNVLLLFMIVNAILGRPLMPPKRNDGGALVLIGFGMLTSTALMTAGWFNDGNVKQLFAEFAGRRKDGLDYARLFFWIYVVASFSMPFLFTIIWVSVYGHHITP